MLTHHSLSYGSLRAMLFTKSTGSLQG
ncbi:unnamed protein product [Oppiella nova]|uniref:Uncharacterized protein n=1 Tax=Oppiella nova TaxID=334625 RepID=A0A7R9MS15_9ACAR|nr:unnamed protein product [Oppiella nova]CAG2181981.1 unnamed protein product [Oppiella nova]